MDKENTPNKKEEPKKEENKKVSFDSDILNLNNDESFVPISEEKEKKPLTEDEKQEVRKKLIILLCMIFISLIVLVVILIFDPFTKDEEKEKDNKEQKEEVKKEDPVITTKIKDLKDGEIEISNSEILTLIDEIEIKTHDHYEYDMFTLFTGNVEINNLPDKYKLFIIGKSLQFNSLIASQAQSPDLCKTEFKIEKDKIDEIAKNRFNTTIKNYEPFIYNYYDYEDYNNSLKFTYINDEYVGTCYTPSNEIDKAITQEAFKATKEGNKLYIDFYVVFANKSGIYKDYNFKELITDESNNKPSLYVGKGNVYRYTYDISKDNYYLINISLQK